jgi:acetoacetate decarboxylase
MSFVKTTEEVQDLLKKEYRYYEQEVLIVAWFTKEEVVAKLLPPPLKPLKYPLAVAYLANFPKTNFEIAYKEGALYLGADFDGILGVYCLAMPVTNDMAMAGGRENYGFPKKMANIELKKTESHLEGWVERKKIRYFSVEADLTGSYNDEKAQAIMNEMFSTGLVNYNFLERSTPSNASNPSTVYLVKQTSMGYNQKAFDIGTFQVEFQKSKYDPWIELEVVKELGAVYMVQDTMIPPLEYLAEVDYDSYRPYSYKMWDWQP